MTSSSQRGNISTLFWDRRLPLTSAHIHYCDLRFIYSREHSNSGNAQYKYSNSSSRQQPSSRPRPNSRPSIKTRPHQGPSLGLSIYINKQTHTNARTTLRYVRIITRTFTDELQQYKQVIMHSTSNGDHTHVQAQEQLQYNGINLHETHPPPSLKDYIILLSPSLC